MTAAPISMGAPVEALELLVFGSRRARARLAAENGAASPSLKPVTTESP